MSEPLLGDRPLECQSLSSQRRAGVPLASRWQAGHPCARVSKPGKVVVAKEELKYPLWQASRPSASASKPLVPRDAADQRPFSPHLSTDPWLTAFAGACCRSTRRLPPPSERRGEPSGPPALAVCQRPARGTWDPLLEWSECPLPSTMPTFV